MMEDGREKDEREINRKRRLLKRGSLQSFIMNSNLVDICDGRV